MKVSNFDEDNVFSKNAKFWTDVYSKLFPTIVYSKYNNSAKSQKAGGADRYIYLRGGQKLRIEEKLRRKIYPDILLEWQSNNNTKSTGWINKNLNVDYLAYGFLPSQECYLLNWRQLQDAWFRNEKQWRREFGDNVPGYNQLPGTDVTWITFSVPVPIKLILRYVADYRYIRIESKHCWISKNVSYQKDTAINNNNVLI